MRAYDHRKPLISIHIPKCAGTSLTTVLQGWFGDNFYRHYLNPQTQSKPPRRDFRARTSLWRRLTQGQQYRANICIHGHFNKLRGFGIQDYYPTVDQFITVLRDPFEIAVSDYFYAKKQGAARIVDGKPAPIAERFRDFADFFEREVLHRTSYITNHMPGEVTLGNFERMFSQQFVYVGVTEDLPTSIQKLADKLGYPRVEVTHANEALRDETVRPGMREAFVKHHPLEYAMYEFAQAHYKD
jgi:hypothetical protein